MRSPIPPSWTPHLLSVLRIVAAAMFILHGTQKLLGYPPSGMERPALASLAGMAGLIETVGGAFMLLGLLTRPVAFVLAGEMAYAYFSVHAPNAFLPITNRGELAALFCFVWLYFCAAGPGPWSVDSLLVRRAARNEEPGEPLTSRSWSPSHSTTTQSREPKTSRRQPS
jgi:putative oxidoreductase